MCVNTTEHWYHTLVKNKLWFQQTHKQILNWKSDVPEQTYLTITIAV